MSGFSSIYGIERGTAVNHDRREWFGYISALYPVKCMKHGRYSRHEFAHGFGVLGALGRRV